MKKYMVTCAIKPSGPKRQKGTVLYSSIFITALTTFGTSSPTTTYSSPAAIDSCCVPEVRISVYTTTWNICLNDLNPGPDSCTEVVVSGEKFFGASLHFTRSDSTGWRYDGITRGADVDIVGALKIEVMDDPEGNLVRACFYVDSADTQPLLHPPKIRVENDRPSHPDTIADNLALHIFRNTHACQPIVYRVVVENRTFTYPPGYRRDPILNYPELSMFHYGMSVRMPTAKSLEDRAELFLYWHVLEHLPELKFDNPVEIMKREAFRNRFAAKRPVKTKKTEKTPLIIFRPLR